MPPPLKTSAIALRRSPMVRLGTANPTTSAAALVVCRACRRLFSASTNLRLFGRTVARQAEQERKYKSRLLVYDAGDARTTWISFWKAVALLQFGTTLVFAVPPLWKNENQPDENLRKAQAVLVGVLGTIPTLTLAYVTAPFTHQIFIQIPEYARRSRRDLMHFARSLTTHKANTANTKVEFVTLRIFPFRKTTTAFVHELRALPPRKLRLANIELPKSDEWVQRQREKGIVRRMFELVNEPRFKFYVKQGRTYTMKTGAPGVWEEVARRILEQTALEAADTIRATAGVKKPVLGRPALVSPQTNIVKRQTSRARKA